MTLRNWSNPICTNLTIGNVVQYPHIRKKAQLELLLNVKAIIGEMDKNEELIYNSANCFAHPQCR